ncbi:MAG: acetyltransferase [Proteobacteria bacterium]|nr:MAG: acetyltransferase [Pseudomonadota bacterium]
MQYDVFNGDADGICALYQYRLANPVSKSRLITGVKRDIALLERLEDVENADINVFDLSMHTNMTGLHKLLKKGNRIFYCDHHFPGDIPDSPLLSHHIDTSAQTCTSLLVNDILKGRFYQWACCGAFGDNLTSQANLLAEQNGLKHSETKRLKEIGELLNYNGYGAELADLNVHPAKLYQTLHAYTDPFSFYENSSTLKRLRDGYARDMEQALTQPEYARYGKNRVFFFPDHRWARRISGVFANVKAQENRTGAHALITRNRDGSMRISVRAPLDHRAKADVLCRQFPTGGGRAAAAGINALPEQQLGAFLDTFKEIYS